MLTLRPANFDDIEEEYLFIKDVPADENGFINEWPGISRRKFDKALSTMIAQSEGRELPEGYVPATYYFLWDNDNIVGEFHFRHYLCTSLIVGAGHIGYYIAPRFRRKGFASAGLRMLMDMIRDRIPEDEFYLRVNKDNPASLKVMLKNGGYIHHEGCDTYYVRIPKEKEK